MQYENICRHRLLSLQRNNIEAFLYPEFHWFQTIIHSVLNAYSSQIKKKLKGRRCVLRDVDLSVSCFWHGQLYVAFSRVSQPINLLVIGYGALQGIAIHKILIEGIIDNTRKKSRASASSI